MEGLKVLIFVVIQQLLQIYSYELVGMSGLVAMFYLLPMALETIFAQHIANSFKNTGINRILSLIFVISSVNYSSGFLMAVAYDSDRINAVIMDNMEAFTTANELAFGYLTVAIVVFSFVVVTINNNRQ